MRMEFVSTQQPLQMHILTSTAMLQAARIVNQQPDFQFPIKSDRAQSWLLTSYLDEVRDLTTAHMTRCLAHHSAVNVTWPWHWPSSKCQLHHLSACICAV